ncbi:diguanylate cyclase (GGDEF) domain-containing protein [Rhizobium sp. NFR03]|nr:diguanylate cyclase (GGDEF) domain-containing protein [Rhizobium sp. NFR03]
MMLTWLKKRRFGYRSSNDTNGDRETRAQPIVPMLHIDHLTGIYNRFALEHDLTALLNRPQSEGRGALLLIDLDRFKFVNDAMDHAAGDEVLISIARRLASVLTGVGTIYRLGADEFAVHVAGSPSRGKIEDICATIKTILSTPFVLSAGEVWIGGSIGIAVPTPNDLSMSALLRRADLAVMKAKQTAGNSHVFYEAGMSAEASARSELEYDLSRALDRNEFFLEYQPIVCSETRMIKAFEALIRWRHPQKGIIAPDQFISIAETTGLIMPIGNWVVRTACDEAKRWPSPIGVAVNVAGDQFRDPTFLPYVRDCLRRSGLAPERLTIEVTESIFSVDPAVIADSLMELRAEGVKIALDDFGIGFSSINNLRRFPLDHLKIDRSFTEAMLGSKRDAELVDIILRLGTTFDVSTTIEGVETERQLEYARSRGANAIQGFLISRPVAAGDVSAILDRNRVHGAKT